MNLEEFKEIYTWVDSKIDRSSSRVMGMTIQVVKVMDSYKIKQEKETKDE